MQSYSTQLLIQVKHRYELYIFEVSNKLSEEIEEQILNFVKEYSAYGPERIEAGLKSTGISVGHTGIYNVLKRKNLNIT